MRVEGIRNDTLFYKLFPTKLFQKANEKKEFYFLCSFCRRLIRTFVCDVPLIRSAGTDFSPVAVNDTGTIIYAHRVLD